jgi:hypothetical protein
MLKARIFTAVWVLAASMPAGAIELEHGLLVELDWADTRLRAPEGRSTDTETSIGTLELSLAALFSPRWRTDLILLAEAIGATDSADYRPSAGAEDKRPDRLHIEEFTLGYSGANVEAELGRMTLPFGRFETALLSDPQTLEIGEASTEAGLRAAWRIGDGYLGGALFDGNLRSIAPDEAGYIVFAGWVGEALQLEAGYLSAMHAGKDAPALVDLALHAQADPWFAGIEWVGALSASRGERPRALHAEFGRVVGADWSLALRYQQTSGFPVLDDGDGRYREWAFGVNRSLGEHFVLGLEYARGREARLRSHATLARLTVEF